MSAKDHRVPDGTEQPKADFTPHSEYNTARLFIDDDIALHQVQDL